MLSETNVSVSVHHPHGIFIDLRNHEKESEPFEGPLCYRIPVMAKEKTCVDNQRDF